MGFACRICRSSSPSRVRCFAKPDEDDGVMEDIEGDEVSPGLKDALRGRPIAGMAENEFEWVMVGERE